MNETNELGKQLGDLIWRGKYWGEGEALEIATKVFKMRVLQNETRQACIQMASTYYSAFNNARSQVRSLIFPLWIFRMIWTYWKANRFVQQFLWLSAEGVKPGITCDEYDVVGSIEAANPLKRQKALAHFRLALCESVQEGRSSSKQALIYVKIARCLKGVEAAESIFQALGLLHHDSDPKESTRVLREAGAYFCAHGLLDRGFQNLIKGVEIARDAGLDDAEIKIKGVGKNYASRLTNRGLIHRWEVIMRQKKN